jgi:hypothetical protein
MFLDPHNQWLPPPEEPGPESRRLSPDQERTLMRLIGFNLLLLFVAPIGGATLLQPLIAWWWG